MGPENLQKNDAYNMGIIKKVMHKTLKEQLET